MVTPACRACRGPHGEIVLDLGEQPACDYFPPAADPGPDPVHPLAMWLCERCGLAQLADDPTTPEEPRGKEPAALTAQAAEAVAVVAGAGLAPAGGRVREYGSPHGGSWLGLLHDRGLVAAGDEPADVIVDCFGLMHAADQAAALAERAAGLAMGGTLLLQYHALETIIGLGQWNALRHGHFAYYSTTALAGMLHEAGLGPLTAWRFDLYGGTILLAASRIADDRTGPDEAVMALLADDARAGARDPAMVGHLQVAARASADAVHAWLAAERAAGRSVLGYGAASRAVALLCSAKVDRALLPGVVDASPAKEGMRMPGTDIPILSPAVLTAAVPDSMLLFVPDLRPEVSSAFPAIEAAGGRWVIADSLGSFQASDSGGLEQHAQPF